MRMLFDDEHTTRAFHDLFLRWSNILVRAVRECDLATGNEAASEVGSSAASSLAGKMMR